MPLTSAAGRLTAVLGPTNTGKTYLAIERMLGHESGMIGFPLRLLAREVYDRVVKAKGVNQVALLTGEEKILPKQARWFLCTAESMPVPGSRQGWQVDGPVRNERDFAFVAVDEAQLGADPERGHVFTDRMLHARGREETMILGSESLAPMVRNLLPKAEIIGRPRFSTLSYAGPGRIIRNLRNTIAGWKGRGHDREMRWWSPRAALSPGHGPRGCPRFDARPGSRSNR